jgi:hypothetical protein
MATVAKVANPFSVKRLPETTSKMTVAKVVIRAQIKILQVK